MVPVHCAGAPPILPVADLPSMALSSSSSSSSSSTTSPLPDHDEASDGEEDEDGAATDDESTSDDEEEEEEKEQEDDEWDDDDEDDDDYDDGDKDQEFYARMYPFSLPSFSLLVCLCCDIVCVLVTRSCVAAFFSFSFHSLAALIRAFSVRYMCTRCCSFLSGRFCSVLCHWK